MHESNVDVSSRGTGKSVPSITREDLDLTTVTLQVPFPVPVLAFLEEEAREDPEDYKDCLVTSVLCDIKRRFECYYRNSSKPAEIAKYSHLLSLMTEQGKLLLTRDQITKHYSSQQEDQHTASVQEDTCLNAENVTIELTVPLPVPVLEELKQQALDDGHDFKIILVAGLLHVQKELFSLDIPSDPSNNRYRELYTLLDEVHIQPDAGRNAEEG